MNLTSRDEIAMKAFHTHGTSRVSRILLGAVSAEQERFLLPILNMCGTSHHFDFPHDY